LFNVACSGNASFVLTPYSEKVVPNNQRPPNTERITMTNGDDTLIREEENLLIDCIKRRAGKVIASRNAWEAKEQKGLTGAVRHRF